MHIWSSKQANNIVCVFSRARALTTHQISDMFEDIDDSDNDPDYVESDNDKDEEDSDEEEVVHADDEDGAVGEEPVVGREDHGELRVYMDPPVERPEAESDRDSGNSLYFI